MSMDFRTVNTTCSYCGCGCGLLLEVLDDKVISTLPVKTHPVSQGSLCIKGWNIHEFIGSDQRLTQPLMRKGSELAPVSWDEAMDAAAQGLKQVVEKYGPAAVAVLASAKVTNEENSLIQKFTRAAIGTNNVDHCARL
jgi:predicted molibdopterin-dependent oxidoreductase YjgC